MWQKQIVIVIPHQTKNPVAILSSVLVSDNNSNTKMANLEAIKDWSQYYCKKEERNKLWYVAPVCTVHISEKPTMVRWYGERSPK